MGWDSINWVEYLVEIPCHNHKGDVRGESCDRVQYMCELCSALCRCVTQVYVTYKYSVVCYIEYHSKGIVSVESDRKECEV